MTYRSLLSVIIALIAVGACQTSKKPSLSVEEAKSITTAFEPRTYTAPPRSIGDVKSVLDQTKPDADAAAARLAQSRAEVPAELSGPALGEFLFDRAVASAEIGDIQSELVDLERAVELTSDPGKLSRYWQRLAFARHSIGDIAGAEEAMETRLEIDLNRAGVKQRRAMSAILSSYRFFATLSARIGDFDDAEAWLVEMEGRVSKALSSKRASRIPAHVKDGWRRNILTAKAQIAEARGDLASAERLFEESIQLWEQWLSEYDVRRAASRNPSLYPAKALLEVGRDTRLRNLATVKLRAGFPVEAEALVREALLNTLGRGGKYRPDTGRLVLSLSEILREQGRYADSEILAREGIEIFIKSGVPERSFWVADGWSRVADSLAVRGDWFKANEYYARARKLSADVDLYRDKISLSLPGLLSRIVAEGEVGLLNEADAVHARQVARYGEESGRAAAARGAKAMALLAIGQRNQAMIEFEAAAKILIEVSSGRNSEAREAGMRRAIARLVLESYLDALASDPASFTSPDAIDLTFRIANAIRNQQVRKALDKASARAAARDPELAELVRREQDTGLAIEAQRRLLSDLIGTANPPSNSVSDLERRIALLSDAHSAIRSEIDSRFPGYAETINPQVDGIEPARETLRPGEALLVTYVGVGRTFVWAVPKSGAALLHSKERGRQDIAKTVARLRRALEPGAQTLGEIPRFNIPLAHALYSDLFEPVRAAWQNAPTLLAVMHGPLGHLPLSVLPIETVRPNDGDGALFSGYASVPWLINNHSISVLPSVASLKTIRSHGSARKRDAGFVGFADPIFNQEQVTAPKDVPLVLASRGAPDKTNVTLRSAPVTGNAVSAGLSSLPRLPETAAELISVAEALRVDPLTSVRIGVAASESAVKNADLRNASIVAFATHGLVPGDLDGLAEPALALTSPAVSGETDEDGLLTMGEVMTLRMDADWVVLSACNTGAGDGAGAEAVSGLGRAFFYAGTRALLVSNWPVETTSAKALTTGVFARQATDPALTRADALRETMVSLIKDGGFDDPDTGARVFSYAHPIFWAPFTLVGDGGGGVAAEG